MSRRKQSKPQHVEFGQNKNVPLSNETLPNEIGAIKTLSRQELVGGNDGTKLTNGLSERIQGSDNSFETDEAVPEIADELVRNTSDQSILEEEDNNSSLPATQRDNAGGLQMTSPPGAGEEIGASQENMAEREEFKHGHFVPLHRSMLHPKYEPFAPQKREDEGSMNGTTYESDEDGRTMHGESPGTHQAGVTDSSEISKEQRSSQLVRNQEDMYTCGRCDASFDLIGDFVQHKKFECTNPSPEPDMTADRHSEGDSHISQEDHSSAASNYLVSGNVIMTNGSDLAMEIDDRQNASLAEDDGELQVDESAENGRTTPATVNGVDASTLQNADVDGKQKYAGERVATPDSVAGSDSPSEKMEEPYMASQGLLQSSNAEEAGRDAVEGGNDDAEKLRKEIAATEAMAQAIQNMTAFASQNTGETGGKPDISAIKYQVRMIQQQQAYQVQMLNFLQWQLALASSNPQAAVAAAAAASARNGVIPNGFGAMQPPLLPTAPGMPGGAFMPQMMAAMAMNNLQNGDGNGMAELAKARLLMGMQHAAAENNHGVRKMCGGVSFGEQEEMRLNDQEQRYQLKVSTPEDRADVNSEGSKPDQMQSKTDYEVARTKSDSGYDEDIRSSSASGGMADDTSSSHGSQEEGELRDNALQATADEHRHRCRFCHKVFGNDSALQIHIRSHTGERPFKCNICGNRFTTKGNLKVHFTRHKSKYPHIPMNSQPVPEYLDQIPTSSGVPYGMSILPEKAVLERPRLHGNPSIHLSPQQASALSQRETQSAAPNVPNLFLPQLNGINGKADNNIFRNDRTDIPNGMGAADVATAIQAQLLQRRRAELLESQWAADEAKKSMRPEDFSEANDAKNPMSLLQAAMLPFLPGIAARQQLENVPPHLRYLLPHHLNALHAQNAANNVGNNNNMDIRLPTLPQSTSSQEANQKHGMASKMAASRQGGSASSSETTKLQRLVENIDRGRVLQKNECHMCHRILSCQSALKLHYRTHTGERPYKCDLCSRAFTTRGNLRTHYSSVHRQQMRPLPPGGNRSSQAETFSCTLCPARFRDPVEFQHHMQMHAVVQAQQQQRMLDMESEERSTSLQNASGANTVVESKPQERRESVDSSMKREESDETASIKNETSQEDGSQQDANEDEERPSSARSSASNDDAHFKHHVGESIVKSEPTVSPKDDNDVRNDGSPSRLTPPATNPLDSLAALSNIGPGTDIPQHTGSMLDHQLAALSRARAGRLTVCEICEKPFSCQSALEIHLRTHTKERPFMCKICQRAFTTKGNLKQHLLTHNITDIPERMLMPVSSPQNDNSASTTPSSSPTPNESQSSLVLKRPSDSVDPTEPNAKRAFPRHWCHICQKQFSSASSLQIHNRTHTGEKPFACNVCGRAFTTKGNLKVHMGTHVWGAGGSRRGRRISMDNPLISPWMKNMTRPRPAQPLMPLPTSGHVADPAALYQQYAAIASGLLNAKQDAASRFMLPVTNGQNGNSASSPVSSGGSPHPPNDLTSPQNRVNGANLPAVSAATEWFLKAYQRTQEQVN